MLESTFFLHYFITQHRWCVDTTLLKLRTCVLLQHHQTVHIPNCQFSFPVLLNPWGATHGFYTITKTVGMPYFQHSFLALVKPQTCPPPLPQCSCQDLIKPWTYPMTRVPFSSIPKAVDMPCSQHSFLASLKTWAYSGPNIPLQPC